MSALAAVHAKASASIGGRWPVDARPALALCAIGSLLLHAMLLLPLARPAPEPPPRAAADQAGTLRALQARLLPPRPAITPAPVPASESVPAPAPAHTAERTVPRPALNAVVPPSEPAPVVAPPAAASGSDDSIPRPLLSVAPVAQTPVVIEGPAADSAIGRHVSILSLFIDEQGQVRRVQANDPPLPPALEAAAREAFMGARFSPGQVDGIAVKSRVRVEVVFDNTPIR